jgi:hypothetical protein
MDKAAAERNIFHTCMIDLDGTLSVSLVNRSQINTGKESSSIRRKMTADWKNIINFLKFVISDNDSGLAVRNIVIDAINVYMAVISKIRYSCNTCPTDADELVVLTFLIQPLSEQGPLDSMLTAAINGWMKAAEAKGSFRSCQIDSSLDADIKMTEIDRIGETTNRQNSSLDMVSNEFFDTCSTDSAPEAYNQIQVNWIDEFTEQLKPSLETDSDEP